MIHAYNKNYLEFFQTNLAVFFDYSINYLNIPIENVWDIFINSNEAKQIENGNPTYLVGISGIELANQLFLNRNETGKKYFSIIRTKEYWVGWSLAYYQWFTSYQFKEINEFINIENYQSLYYPFHEMDLLSLYDKLESFRKEKFKETNLKRIRMKLGITQKELSIESNIPLRSIQEYEQNRKSINNAKSIYIISLSKVLCCEPIELIETEFK